MFLVRSFVILVAFAIFVFAQVSPEALVDEFVKGEMERQKIPGGSLAVIKDGKPLIIKGYCLANVEHNVPVNPYTIFQPGSIGKQFTSFAVMLLVEDGKVKLDEGIGNTRARSPQVGRG